MDDQRIDFSALDPGRDTERFERMVQAVLARSAEPKGDSLASALVASGRVVVAAAAAMAVLVWIPLLAPWDTSTVEVKSADPVALVSAWAQEGAIPNGVDVFHVLGVNNAR
jgi:hypothetical protein